MSTGASAPSAPSTLDGIRTTLAARGLELGRCWPRDQDHLLLEVHEGSTTVAGQWFSSPRRSAAAAERTPGAEQLGQVVLQPAGADRRLPALAGLLRRPGAVLMAHRPERRAVVRLGSPGSAGGVTGYVKMVRDRSWSALVATTRLAADLPVRTPALLEADEASSTVVTEPLLGPTLHALLMTPSARLACRQAGQALAAVHRTPPPAGLTHHDAQAEARVTARWQGLASVHGLGPALPVPPGPAPGPAEDDDELVVIHRDFHDKQIVVTDDGSVGLLDFDLMALGSPVLDLANLLAHLDLRAHQGLVADPAPLRTAVLEGYQPSEAQLRRLAGYEHATWVRLAAVYAFRPSGTQT